MEENASLRNVCKSIMFIKGMLVTQHEAGREIIVYDTVSARAAWYSPAEKAMAPHSSTLAWKIPWTEEPGRLQSMGLLRVGHN